MIVQTPSVWLQTPVVSVAGGQMLLRGLDYAAALQLAAAHGGHIDQSRLLAALKGAEAGRFDAEKLRKSENVSSQE